MAATPPPPPVWSGQADPLAQGSVGWPAGFWLRFVAALIDSAILGVPVMIIVGGLVAAFYDATEDDAVTVIIVGVLAFIVVLIGGWLYEALLTSSAKSATLGKQALGLRILHANGARLGFGRATGRYFAKSLITPNVPFLIGYLMAAFTQRKRALHDFIADTVVVRNLNAGEVAEVARLSAAGIAAAQPAASPPPPVWDARPSDPASVAYGGFWLRVVAYIIDAILLYLVAGVVSIVTDESLFAADKAHFPFKTQLISVVIGWLYFALLESSERGATVGKMVVGLRVVTEQGNRLSFLNATGRHFAKYISTLILGIGFLMVGLTDKKRGLHDMMAGTLVVKNR